MIAFLAGAMIPWALLALSIYWMEAATAWPIGAMRAWVIVTLVAPVLATIVSMAFAVLLRPGDPTMVARSELRAIVSGVCVGIVGAAVASLAVVGIDDHPLGWIVPALSAASVTLIVLVASPRVDPLTCVDCGYDLRSCLGIQPCPECGRGAAKAGKSSPAPAT
ncbi:MAG: hypothetical protein ACF8QF_09385 [Phycisphaerales bacterium]